MPERVDYVVGAFADKRDDAEHRFDAIVDAAQVAAARPEFMSWKIEAVDTQTVACEKRAEKIEILFARRVAMTGDHADAARAAGFVL
jgi:hypothetical protein